MTTATHPRLLKTSNRHGRGILRRVQQGIPVQGAEVGVCRGALSRYLLGNRPELELILVDHWRTHDPASEAYRWAERENEPCNIQTQAQVDDNRRETAVVAEKYQPRARIVWESSVRAAARIPNGSLDFVFIDADHRLAEVLADVIAWAPKVRPAGWIGGHDYKTPGMGTEVAEAVEKLLDLGTIRGPLELDEFYTWFARPAGGVS